MTQHKEWTVHHGTSGIPEGFVDIKMRFGQIKYGVAAGSLNWDCNGQIDEVLAWRPTQIKEITK